MKIGLITGSRADSSGLDMVGAALTRREHDVRWVVVTPNAPVDHRPSIAADAGCACARAAFSCDWDELDLVFVCGDRTEALGAAVGAYIAGVPIAHIAGGDVTPGSADDAQRDAITALSSIHFTTHRQASDRLVSMGYRRVLNLGSPALDRVLRIGATVSRETHVQGDGRPWTCIVAVHPDTSSKPVDEVGPILKAVEYMERYLGSGLQTVVLSPNRDRGFKALEVIYEEWVGRCPTDLCTRRYEPNLPHDQFISLLANADFMVGNSSAGVYEAPALGVPSIVVGRRQEGRPRTAFGYCPVPNADAITRLLVSAAHAGSVKPCTVFGDGNAAEKIADFIDGIAEPVLLLTERRVA